GPRRHGQDEVAPAGAGALAPGAAAPVRRAEMLLVAIIDQRVEVVLSEKDDVAAFAAVAAVRAAELDEFLAPEARRAGAAVAAFEVDLALVEKFHRASLSITRSAFADAVPARSPTRPPNESMLIGWSGERAGRHRSSGGCPTALDQPQQKR